MSFFFNYWIGEGTDLKKYWNAYYEGEGYKQKFLSMKCHVFEITFAKNEINLPLYNLEPIYKTLKSYYHDVKGLLISKRV